MDFWGLLFFVLALVTMGMSIWPRNHMYGFSVCRDEDDA